MDRVESAIYLGLGSSAGTQALPYLRRAVAALKRVPGVQLTALSSVYRSQAQLPPDAPRAWDLEYRNLCVRLELGSTPPTPTQLLAQLQAIERSLGRVKRERWAPRPIDIDLLVWSGVRLASAELTLPHPRLGERPFALLPLLELLSPASAERELPAEWRERGRTWSLLPGAPFGTERSLEPWTRWMGILNVTPDSFSDGGRLLDPVAFEAQARALITAGAEILDIGAESTRPGATPIDAEIEWSRLRDVLPIAAALRREFTGLEISLDTQRPATLERALTADRDSLDWINDVGGFADRNLVALAAQSSAKLCVMHSLGVPPTRDRQLDPARDPIEQIMQWIETRSRELEAAGIARERIVFDPGIGFGKSQAQNLLVLRSAWRLHASGYPLLVGHSRKSCLAPLAPVGHTLAADARDPESAWIAADLDRQGVEYVRLHDPGLSARLTRVSLALRSPVSV